MKAPICNAIIVALLPLLARENTVLTLPLVVLTQSYGQHLFSDTLPCIKYTLAQLRQYTILPFPWIRTGVAKALLKTVPSVSWRSSLVKS